MYFLLCMWTETPSSEPSSVLYIAPNNTSSIQELMMQKCNKAIKSLAFDVKRTLDMSNLTIFYSFPSISSSSLIGLGIQTTMLPMCYQCVV